MNRTIIFSGFIIGLSLTLGCRHPAGNDSAREWEISQTLLPCTLQSQPAPACLPAYDTLTTGPVDNTPIHGILTKGKIKKKKKKPLPPPQEFDQETVQDRIETIWRLKSKGYDVDIASGRRLLSTRGDLEKRLNEELLLVNPNIYFCINFENDIFTNTDRYYTNGIRFDWVNPGFNRSLLTHLMIPLHHPARNYYGISLVHRIYTPWDSHIDTVTQGDRPFSSYLYFGFSKVSNALGKRYRQHSAFNLGIIGPAAGGKQIQQTIHYTEINGWDHQVSNDIILDYHVHSEAGLLQGKYFEIGALADANAGTLYDKIGIGPYLTAGNYDPASLDQVTEGTWGQINPTSGKVQYVLYYRFKTTLVGYDATLQGGMFNKSEYALNSSQIKRFTYDHCLGFSLSFRWASVLAEYTWLSPEYKGCDPHSWGRCTMAFTL
ncbi:MAG TPA: lipid A deacylase LpxR family protein [Bacteroidales bacterium]|nr:lipid A deacylase LpxR family protein [Bacteroidales bacterium]